jgi:Winged helix-turn helix
MVVVAISLRALGVDGTRRPGGRTALRWVCGHRLLSGQACSAGGAKAGGRGVEPTDQVKGTKPVDRWGQALPRPPERSSQWTLPRVAEVVWRLTGVSYHPGHVWWLLRRHQWSPQRPARRAAERDEDAIARWRAEDWPRIKGGR